MWEFDSAPQIRSSSALKIELMQPWQRRARVVVAVFGVVFAIFVARELKRRDPPATAKPVVRTDPGAVIETTGGFTQRIKRERDDVDIAFKKQFVYQDGSSKLEGVTVVFDERNGSRTFTITGKEGRLGKGASTMVLDGDVKLVGSDGMTLVTEHVTYADAD